MAQIKRNPSGAPKRRNDPEKTRQNILDIALGEFVERGYSGARVDAIAANTQTSKRMLYYYFNDKEGLYQAVLRAAYNKIRNAEQALDLTGLKPDAALRQLSRFTMDHHQRNPEYVRLIMIENIHHGRFASQLTDIAGLNAGAIAVLDQIYTDGLNQGLFRPGIAPIDLHWMISALAFFSVSNKATFRLLFHEQMKQSGYADTNQLAEDIVLRFVAVPKGPASA